MRYFQASRRGGFTLIELMIVVAIIGVLASIAIPKFANLVVRSKEAAVQGQLGGLRSAVTVYYSDNEGSYPNNLSTDLTTNSKYLNAIPSISIPSVTEQGNPGHPNSSAVCGSMGCFGFDFSGSNIWAYAGTGLVNINCTHKNSTGLVWTNF